jgi:hypothetical protein
VRKTLTILTLITALAAGLVGAPPASASFYNLGVKSVDFDFSPDACLPGLFACTPNAGDGMSNRLYVRQVETSNGLQFADLDTTSAFGDSHLWLGATIGAECRAGYKLESATIIPGWHYANGSDKVPQELYSWSLGISVPNAKTMPSKQIAINLPMSSAFGDGAPSHSLVHEFPSLDAVYAYGESVIANRIASGMSEADARAQGFVFEANVALSARVWCTPNGAGRDRYKTMPEYLPLMIEFVGEPKPGAQDQAVGGGVAVAPRVTDVDITVTPSTHGECILYVSAWFEADADLTAYYRIIDQYGQRSNAFAVQIGKQGTTVRSHHIPIPYADTSPDGPSLVAPTGPGQIGGLVVEDIGKVSGNYQIEVYSPNLIRSRIVGFSVDPCPVPTEADVPEATPTPPAPQPPAPGPDSLDGGSTVPDPTPPPSRQPGGLTLG